MLTDHKDVPDEGEYVELTFEGEHGSQSPIRGRVLWVDTDCTDIPLTTLYFAVDNGENNREIHYAEGEDEDGEPWANVHRCSDFSGTHLLGDKSVTWRRLE